MPLPKLKTTQKHSWAFSAIGTQWEIVSSSKLDQALKAGVSSLISDFDSVYSRFRDDSVVGKMRKRAGEYTLPYSPTLLGFYEELYALTDGSVSPLIGGALEDLGYDKSYSLVAKSVIRRVPKFSQVVRRSGESVTITEPVTLDVGAAGKGLLVDIVVEYMQRHGHDNFVVDASGDLRVVGNAAEVIGLEDPRNVGRVIGSVTLKGRALCASSVNRRAWGNVHHIINALSGVPAKDIIATWVIADTAMIADGLATALFFTSPQVLKSRYNYEYVRIHANGSVEYSDYFKGGLF